MRRAWVAILLLAGCRYSADIGGPDGDGDAYGALVDCDDGNPDVHPGQTETPYNGVDDDCDPDTPDDDLDGDGYGAEDDCDDTVPTVHPDADEQCNGVDDDCDEQTDEALGGMWYADADSDGFGDDATATETCTPGAGLVDVGGDCNDDDSAIHPAADEQCDATDHDCDGSADLDVPGAPVWFPDDDGDTWGDPAGLITACTQPAGYVDRAGDCDDDEVTGGASFPGADEVCDDLDNDCDLAIDEGATDAATWYYDGDGDNFGAIAPALVACEPPADWVSTGGDCDDTRAAVYPDALEVCDGVANDCNQPGVVDVDAADATTWYADEDGDGWGNPEISTAACTAPADHVATDLDCYDDPVDGAAAEPGGIEVCDDGLDNDCDSVADNAFDASVWFEDADDDGYGEASSYMWACDAPAGFVANPDDCDDDETTGPAVNPGATESCNSVDDDCNGLVDDDVPGGDAWYADRDGDGFGDDATEVSACSQPSAIYVADGGDCDDGDTDFHPDATDTCDGLDRNCTGANDFDADGDGYIGTAPCTIDDCDDDDVDVFPGAGGCSAGESCLDAWLRFGFDIDEIYWIDPPGGGGPFEAYCDMTDDGDRPGPGWTLVYLNDFDSGETGGWDATPGNDTVVTCVDSDALTSGDHNNHDAYLDRDFDDLGVPHTDWYVQMEYLFVDNWEGVAFTEYAWLDINGARLWWGLYDEINFPGATDLCGGTGVTDESEAIGQGFYDPGSTINVAVGADLSAADEWFAIDDVIVWVR